MGTLADAYSSLWSQAGSDFGSGLFNLVTDADLESNTNNALDYVLTNAAGVTPPAIGVPGFSVATTPPSIPTLGPTGAASNNAVDEVVSNYVTSYGNQNLAASSNLPLGTNYIPNALGNPTSFSGIMEILLVAGLVVGGIWLISKV